MPFAERLKNLRLSLRLSQTDMGERLAISKNYVWQLEAGTKEPGPRIVREVELLGQAPDLNPAAKAKPASRDLAVLPPSSGKIVPAGDIMRDVRIPLRHIPLLSYAQMGALTSYEEIPRGWQQNIATDVTDPGAFAVTLMGDSMEPKYTEGDIATLLPSSEPRQSSLVVVRMNDESVVCKLYSRKGSKITLSSYNKAYKPFTVNAADVSRIYPVHSVMKIVWK